MDRLLIKTLPIKAAGSLLLATATLAHADTGTPLLTGVIEDVEAQTIEMPSLPGGWQRRIEWMSPEGTRVGAGDVVVRLDPGTLIAEEEKARTDLEKRRFTAARSIDEKQLEVIDAEMALAEAASNLRLAEMDASIPEDTIPRLDFERNQLALTIYLQIYDRAKTELTNQRAALDDTNAQADLDVEQAELEYQRITQALAATEIKAEKAGYVIYGSNPFTGRKIYPGDTLYSGLEIASVASRNDLRVRIWIHEADFMAVSTGQRLRIVTDAQGIEPFMATVDWRSNQAIEKQDWSGSGYFEAYAAPELALPDSVMPGMSVMAIPDRTPES